MSDFIVQVTGGFADGFEFVLEGGPDLVVGAEMTLRDRDGIGKKFRVERIEGDHAYVTDVED